MRSPPTTSMAPPLSASGKPMVAMTGNAALTDRGSRSGQSLRKAGTDDLVSSMGRVSMCSPKATLIVPPISAYASGKPAVAVAGMAVVIGEAIPDAKPIPENFSSTSGYLKV